MQIGSSERLPLVATTGTAQLGQQQMVQRRIGQHGADQRIARRHRLRQRACALGGRARSAARARSAPRSRRRSASAASPSASSEANITANGFSSRCLRWRSARTASSLRASAIRWKPPRPFTATILPSRRAPRRPPAARRRAPPAPSPPRPTAPVAARRPGRHWARHGSAGRPGSRIRAWHSGHMTKRRMVVRCRS